MVICAIDIVMSAYDPKATPEYLQISSIKRTLEGKEIVVVGASPVGTALTHRGRVTHICVSNLTIIGSDNGLSPDRRQAIICTSAGILLIGPLGTNFGKNLIGIQIFSFYKMHMKMSSAKWRPFCLGLNELTASIFATYYLNSMY